VEEEGKDGRAEGRKGVAKIKGATRACRDADVDAGHAGGDEAPAAEWQALHGGRLARPELVGPG
jgi:hypothetical protein